MRKIIYLVGLVICAVIFIHGGYLIEATEKPDEDEIITVEFPSWWWGEPGNNDFLAELVDAFEEEYPNIEINGYDVGFAEYQDSVVTRVSAGKPPHIIHLLDWYISQYQDIGALAPLDKYLNKTDITKRFIKLQTEPPLKVSGKTYGILQGIFNYIPFYNEKLFKEKGIEEFPEDFDEFIKVVEKLTDPPNVYGYAIANKPGDRDHMMQNFSGYVVGYGGKIDKVTSPQTLKAVRMFKKAYESSAIPPDTEHTVFYPMWWNGKVACLIEGSYMYGMASAENPEILPHLATALPPFPTKKSIVAVQILSIAAGLDEDEEAAAWKFVEFWSRPEWQARQVEVTMSLSPEIGGGISQEMLQKYPWMKNFATAAETAEYPYTPVNLPWLAQINKTVIDYLEKILFLDAPIEETMEDCQRELDRITSGG
jgi:multiple sugar transport system substrate-binding protein